MARVKVKLNSAGMNSLLNDAGVASDLASRANAVLSSARSSAPYETGEYASSLFATVVNSSSLGIAFRFGGSRPVAVVGTRAPHGGTVEWRTGNLAKALDSAGGA